MRKSTAMLVEWICCGLILPGAALAQASDRPDGMRFVPDVPGQFRALTESPDPLGFNVGGSPDPSTCRHYQGVVRVDGADGTPFFLVTRSGNTPFPPGEIGCDDSDGETRNGHLIVFRMGSRDKNGERLRSNRLAKGRNFDATRPDLDDKASIYYTVVDGGLVPFDGQGGIPPKVYQHPGGMQVVGNVLGLALESPRETGPHSACVACVATGDPTLCNLCYDYEPAPNRTLIMFLDVSDPEHPQFLSQFVPKNSSSETLAGAGVLALTPLPDGHYLMLVTGGKNTTWFFYRSTLPSLSDPALSWELVRSLPGPGVEDAHQTLHFLREGDINGQLYLAGARGVIFFDDRDRIDLYRIDCDTPNCRPGERMEWTVRYNGQRISPFAPPGGFEKLANLAAASGFYVSPSGELLFYATEHDNDGPNLSVKAGEWRHRNVVRPGSPTLLPSARVNGPYEVAEGGSVQLSGLAAPPVTKAWFQGFWDKDFGPFSWIADYDDYDKDDFDDLAVFEPVTFLGATFPQNDRVQSWKWFAPTGCSLRAIDLHNGSIDETVTLNGTGTLVTEPDLRQLMNDGGTDDINAELDAMQFLQNCAQHYATPVALHWDLNQDGSYEGSGSSVSFSAAGLDGPSVVSVGARAEQGGSESGRVGTTVTIRNVAPWISDFVVTDSAGKRLGIDVPFALTGLPVTVAATFTDPGLPDHQTASIDWGDGGSDLHTAFSVFDEAYGDGSGRMEHTHRYTSGGQLLLIAAVEDDDGGRGTQGATVTVLTPEQAVGEIIAMLDALIALTTDAKALAYLRQARDVLAGRNDYSNNGALNKIQGGNTSAAIASLDIALNWLAKASAIGSNTAMIESLIRQVAAALRAG